MVDRRMAVVDGYDDDHAMVKIGHWKAFVTQTEWSGQVMHETWYGHHHPCRRIAMFVLLSCMCSTIALSFHAFLRWPILDPFLTVEDLTRISTVHENCFTAICTSLEHIDFECEMSQDGKVLMDDFTVSVDRIPLPWECREAIRVTFGPDVLEDKVGLATHPLKNHSVWSGLESNPSTEIILDLIHFQDMTERHGMKHHVPIFQVIPERCLLQENILEYNFPFVDSFVMQAGDRERIELRNFACLEHMSSNNQNLYNVMPKMKQLYNLFMAWRVTVLLGFLCFVQMAGSLAKCGTRVLFLLVPSLFLWLFLPKNKIRERQISWYSTISTLLLLRTLSDSRSGELEELIRTGIVASGALWFGNKKAALEWCFLFFISYMDFGVAWDDYWWNDTVADAFHRVYTSHSIVDGIQFLIALLLPGSGFWKLVTLYVVVMSFPVRNRPSEAAPVVIVRPPV